MSITGLLYAKKETINLATSLKTIKKNAADNLNNEFKAFVKERATTSNDRNINTDKIIEKKLKEAETPVISEAKDTFEKATTKEKKKNVNLRTVLNKFNKDATQFLIDASPEEIKILKNYFNKHISTGRKIDKWLATNNECTDKKDDGKIGFKSIVGNILEGAAKTAVGCVKDLLDNPIKLIGVVGTAVLFFGLSCTPIGAAVLPIVGLCTGGKLIYDGGKKIIKNVKYACNATNDKEAKDRWENVGNGGLKVGVGVLVGCTSAKEAKDIFGGSTKIPGAKLKDIIIDKFKNIVKNAKDCAKTRRADLKTTEGLKNLFKEIFEDPTNLVEDNT